MAQAMAEEGGRVPMSPGLQATLLRARDYAASQSQPHVLLEHLLLALTEDQDAVHVLEVSQVDIARLRHDMAGYIGAMPDRVPPGTPGAPAISTALTQVLKYATLAAQQGRRASIDGAIVLAALVGDGRSMAASFLKAQGLTFEAAIKALREASARPAGHTAPGPGTGAVSQPSPLPNDPRHSAAPAEPHPLADISTTPRAESLLAQARERVVNRTAQNQTARTEPPVEASAQHQPSNIDGRPSGEIPKASAPQGMAAPQPPVGQAPPLPASAMKAPPSAMRELVARAQPASAATANAPSGLPPAQPNSTARLSPAASAPQLPSSQLPPAIAWAPSPTPQHPQAASAQPSRPAQPSDWSPRPAPAPATPHRGPMSERPSPASAPWAELQHPSPAPPQQQQPQARSQPAEQHQPRPFPTPQPTPPSPGASGEFVAPTRGPAIDESHVAFAMPQRWKMGRSQVIEVRVERPPLAGGGGGQRPHALRAETVVARAISVRLRPHSGRFMIDAASPETQWDQGGGGGRLSSEAAVWRFTVTPLATGRSALQLSVSARTMGADGVLAETQLPEQPLEMRAAAHLPGIFSRLGIYAGVALASMIVLKLLEGLIGLDLYFLVRQLLR